MQTLLNIFEGYLSLGLLEIIEWASVTNFAEPEVKKIILQKVTFLLVLTLLTKYLDSLDQQLKHLELEFFVLDVANVDKNSRISRLRTFLWQH